MLKTVGKWFLSITLLYMVSGCGNADENARGLNDNRDRYLIKNRNHSNEYMDKRTTPDNEYKENVNPHMDSAQSLDEQEDRKRTSIKSRKSVENDVERNILTRVTQIPGITGADVDLQGQTVRIIIQTTTGSDPIALANKVEENIRLLYNYKVMVSSK